MKVARCTDRRSGDDERGVACVETALTIVPFLVIIFGIVKLAVVGFSFMALQYSVWTAARVGSITSTGTAAARAAVIVAKAQSQAETLGLEQSNITFKVCPLPDPGCSGADPGGSNQYVVVSGEKQVSLFWNWMRITLKAKALVKNEPF